MNTYYINRTHQYETAKQKKTQQPRPTPLPSPAKVLYVLRLCFAKALPPVCLAATSCWTHRRVTRQIRQTCTPVKPNRYRRGTPDKRKLGVSTLQYDISISLYLRALELLPVERGAGIIDFFARGTMLRTRYCRGGQVDSWWVSGVNGEATPLLHTAVRSSIPKS